MNIKLLISAVSLALLAVAMPVCADSAARQSQGSANISAASGLIVAGSTSVVTGSGQLLVSSIAAVDDSAIVVLQGVSEAGSASLKMSGELAAAASLAVGTIVQVTAESTGYALSAAGRLIAFIPNEIGLSLLYHSQYYKGN